MFSEADEPSDGWLFGERLVGDWYRTFSLPEYLDAKEARAAVSSGVLTIQIPKRAVPAPLSIPVTVS